MLDFIISGASGDIGSQLLEHLKKDGFNVSPYPSHKVWQARQTDFSSSLPECHTFLHLAACHPVHSTRQLIEANLHYLQAVLTERAGKYQQFVFMSSSSVYGKGCDGEINEQFSGRDIDTYGMTKILAERLLMELPVPTIALRPPAILELKNQYNLLSRLFNRCFQGQSIQLANGDLPFNTWISVAQLAKLIGLIRQQEALHNWQVFNVAATADLSLKEIVAILSQELSSDSMISNTESDTPCYQLNLDAVTQCYGYDPGDSEQHLRHWCQQRLLSGTSTEYF